LAIGKVTPVHFRRDGPVESRTGAGASRVAGALRGAIASAAALAGVVRRSNVAGLGLLLIF
jgi:hypothetical protein